MADYALVVDSPTDAIATRTDVLELPISTATQAALDAKQATAAKGQANGYASLDGAGLVPVAQIPALPPAPVAWTDVTGKPAFGTASLEAVGFFATAAQGVLADSALQPAGNGSALTGLTKTQVGLANVDNTSDANKPVSTAQQTALDAKVPTSRTVNGQALSSNVTITTITGNAGTATALATPRTINGVSFDGTANITISAAASLTTVEKDLGSSPTWQGRFVITDAAISSSSKVVVTQAPGPYTGKGTLADEAEMDQIVCVATPATGSASIYWRVLGGIRPVVVPKQGKNNAVGITGGSPNLLAPPQDDPQTNVEMIVLGRVKGNMKFHYSVAA